MCRYLPTPAQRQQLTKTIEKDHWFSKAARESEEQCEIDLHPLN